MKRYLVAISTITFAVFFMISCGPVKDGPDVGGDKNPIVSASNKQLAKYPIGGFAYKSSQMPAQEWQKWAKVAAPIVKDITSKIPDGYALEVRGHTDTSGPEQPVGNKPGNIKISTDRARVVYNSLKNVGITSNKLKYKGVGSSETIPGVDGRSAKQRRVTFVIVPQ